MNDTTDYFIHPTIAPVKGRPTRESMHNLQCKIFENAASVLFELGGGMHRHLRVVMSNKEHIAKFGTTFEPCENLGPLPECPQNATQHQIAAQKVLHARRFKLFNEQRKVIQVNHNSVVQHFKP